MISLLARIYHHKAPFASLLVHQTFLMPLNIFSVIDKLVYIKIDIEYEIYNISKVNLVNFCLIIEKSII